MTDDQLDALLRSVTFDDAMDPAFVARSSEELLGSVRRARIEDASPMGRLGRDLRGVWRLRGRAGTAPTARAASVLALLILGVVAGLIITGALHRTPPFGNGLLVVSLHGELQAIDPVSGSVRRLAPMDRPADGVSRSPDGTVATFWTRGGDSDRLYAVELDGGERRELAPGVSMSWDQSIDTWSPDSRSLATEVTLDGFARILVVDVASGKGRVLTPPDVTAHNPLWSPDGRWIAFTPELGGHRGLSVIRSDGTDLHDVGGDLHGLTVAGPDTWSPDGWIYFSADDATGSHVFRANVEDRTSQQLTGDDLRAYATASSPDGSTIAFIVDAAYGFDLWVAASDGTGPRRILEAGGLGGWSSDGQLILVRWKPEDDSLGGLGTIRPDGTDLRILVPFDPSCRHGWDEQCVLGFGWGQARP